MLAYRELNYRKIEEGVATSASDVDLLVAYSILFFDGNTPHPSFNT